MLYLFIFWGQGVAGMADQWRGPGAVVSATGPVLGLCSVGDYLADLKYAACECVYTGQKNHHLHLRGVFWHLEF